MARERLGISKSNRRHREADNSRESPTLSYDMFTPQPRALPTPMTGSVGTPMERLSRFRPAWFALVGVCVMLSVVATACSGTSAPTTATGLAVDVEAMLEARAMKRACSNCVPEPVCVWESYPPELVAALKRVFPAGVMLVGFEHAIGVTSTVPEPNCLVLPLGVGSQPALKRLSDTVVGVDVWRGTQASTYWFRWDGSDWVKVTPEEVGVTDTTVVT